MRAAFEPAASRSQGAAVQGVGGQERTMNPIVVSVEDSYISACRQGDGHSQAFEQHSVAKSWRESRLRKYDQFSLTVLLEAK